VWAGPQELLAGSKGKYYQVRGTELSQDFLAPVFHIPNYLNTLAFANNIIHNYRTGKVLDYPTLEDGSIIPSHVIASIRDTAKTCTFEIKWRDGDLLMFDNTRFMHGRRHIIDSDRLIWTQFASTQPSVVGGPVVVLDLMVPGDSAVQ
jgi:Taurine catabolism dioxygenase TauD, TfdA family